LQFYFRTSFHDLLSRDDGLAPWSKLNILSFLVRRDLNQNFYLEDFRALDILSTSAVNLLQKPNSWGFSLGAHQNGPDPTHIAPDLDGKIGYSLDLMSETKLRWVLLAKAAVDETPDLHMSLGLGYESLLLARFAEHCRGEISFGTLYMNSWAWQNTQLRIAMDLTKSLEFHLGWKEDDWTSGNAWGKNLGPQIVDKFAELRYQFLF
jgi:hypothetical protein